MLKINHSKVAVRLACFHILIIASSNFLVQLPVTVFGFITTWGTFTFPFIFLTTDLTVRIFGAPLARRIIFLAMFPALLVSYVVTVLFRDGVWMGAGALFDVDWFVLRIVIASFSAYIVGQIMDIFVFNKLRQRKQWWPAPLASAVLGNAVDTFTFYLIAFYRTSDPYLSEHVVEIGTVDYIFKITVNVLFFLPLYKVVLDLITKKWLGINGEQKGYPGRLS